MLMGFSTLCIGDPITHTYWFHNPDYDEFHSLIFGECAGLSVIGCMTAANA